MAKFSYVIKDKAGKTYKNVVDAYNKDALVKKFYADGYFIVSITEVMAAAAESKDGQIALTQRKRRFTHTNITLEDLLSFSRQLSVMLEAGVPVVRSLGVIETQVDSKEFAKIVQKICADVKQGTSLSVALAKYPRVFNQFWVSLIEVGEASGTIPVILNKLFYYLEQQASFKSTIISGLIYPAILFCVACGAIAFFALFVGPKFEEIFTAMNAKIPLITTWLLGAFRIVRVNFIWITGGLIVSIFLFLRFLRTYSGKIAFEKFLFGLPTVGEVFQNIILERFASQMSTLIDSGVPLLYALDITERLVDNNTYALIVGKIKDAVKKGEPLTSPMERSGLFPSMCIQMIMVGQETGELSKMLKHMASYYQNNVEIFMKRFATIIEPFMLVFMGGVIGVIVVAMFLPLFNIAQLGGASGH